MVRVRDARGEPRLLPGVAPVAMQQGRYAAALVRARLRGRLMRPFRYRDKGNVATIGRARAVADLHVVRLSGFPAWITWLVVHLFYLVGFQNRLLVLVSWAFSFATRGRGARIISPEAPRAEARQDGRCGRHGRRDAQNPETGRPRPGAGALLEVDPQSRARARRARAPACARRGLRSTSTTSTRSGPSARPLGRSRIVVEGSRGAGQSELMSPVLSSRRYVGHDARAAGRPIA